MRFICTIVFLTIIISSFTMFGQKDIEWLKEINVNRNRNLDNPMKFISNSEAYIGISIPVSTLLIAAVKKDKLILEKGINMTMALAASSVNTFILKRVIDRPRPSASYTYIEAFENEKHYSFPSGHTSNAFVTATSFSLNFRKWYYIIPSYTWACAVAYSRMHLGMHYPSDVFAGALLGAGSAIITFKANQWIKKYYIQKFTTNEQHVSL